MQIKSTLNIDEVSKFAKIADHWWQANGKYKLLHDITPIRLEFIKAMITQFIDRYSNLPQVNLNERINLSNLTILDVGCGGGLTSIPLASHGAKVTAIDAGRENIIAAQTMAEVYSLDICFINQTIEDFNNTKQTDTKYDVVLALEVVEHVENIDFFIANLAQNINDNGILIISTINRNFSSFIQTKLIAEYFLNWLEIGTHKFEKYVKPSELYNIATKLNLILLNQTGLKYSLLDKSWYLEQNLDVNYFTVFKKF